LSQWHNYGKTNPSSFQKLYSKRCHQISTYEFYPRCIHSTKYTTFSREFLSRGLKKPAFACYRMMLRMLQNLLMLGSALKRIHIGWSERWQEPAPGRLGASHTVVVTLRSCCHSDHEISFTTNPRDIFLCFEVAYASEMHWLTSVTYR
jgi:hypothetical protein